MVVKYIEILKKKKKYSVAKYKRFINRISAKIFETLELRVS